MPPFSLLDSTWRRWWFEWTRAIHGARPSGALRASKSAILPICLVPAPNTKGPEKGPFLFVPLQGPPGGYATVLTARFNLAEVVVRVDSRHPWRSPFGRTACVQIGNPADLSGAGTKYEGPLFGAFFYPGSPVGGEPCSTMISSSVGKPRSRAFAMSVCNTSGSISGVRLRIQRYERSGPATIEYW